MGKSSTNGWIFGPWFMVSFLGRITSQVHVYKTLAGMKINKSHGCDCSWCLEWPGMKVEGKMMEDDRNLCCLIFRAL
jgi:hypothetical protein